MTMMKGLLAAALTQGSWGMEALSVRGSKPRWPLLLVFCFLLAGCTTVSDIEEAGKPIPKGEGILLVSVDTDSKITKLLLADVHGGSDDEAAADLPLGKSVQAILLPAGDYAWTRLDMPDILMADKDYLPDSEVLQTWVDIGRDGENHPRHTFSVKPGIVNYPGDLIVRGSDADLLVIDWSYNTPGIHPIPGAGHETRLVDRLATTLDGLDPQTKALIARYGLVYSGPGADSFPAYQRSIASGASLAASGATASLPADRPIPAADFFLRPAESDVSLSPDGRKVLMVTHPNQIYSQVVVMDLATRVGTTVMQVPNPNENFAGLRWISADVAVFTVDSAAQDAVFMAMRWRMGADGSPDPQLKQWGGKYWIMDARLQDGKRVALGATYGMQPDEHRCLRIADIDAGPDILKIHPCSLDLDPAMVNWEVSGEGRLEARVIYTQDGMLHFQKPLPGDISGWKDFKQIDPIKQTFEIVGAHSDSDRFDVLSDLDTDTVAYQEYDPDTDKVVKTLFEKEDSDVTDVHYDQNDSNFSYLTWYSGPEPHHEMRSAYARAAMPALQQAFPGDQVLPLEFSKDGTVALAYVYSDTDPGAYYAFDMKTRRAQPLGAAMPWLPPAALAPEKVGSIKTADGLTIDYLLTLPRTGAQRFPLVVIPHGGPIGVFDAKSFDPEAQLLASRGYAVLKVNYRGSGGKGLKFQQAGEKEWGLKIEDDISEAVHSVLRSAPVDPARVCIFGASYGGYSALVSAAREPALYRCAASLDGVTDIPLLYDASDVQSDAATRKAMTEITGDPTTDADKLRSVSPVYLAAKIQCPVLIAQGEKDTQVDPEQAYRMKATLEALHKPVTYLTYPKEGHGFDNPPDEADFYTQLLAFLDEYDSGR